MSAGVGVGLLPSGQGVEEPRLSADFDNVAGKIRPALHSSGFGPTICSQTEQDLADVKVSCAVLDHMRDLVEDAVNFKDGILTLKKADANSAAYFVEFEENVL